jgi:hypothetical protein
MDDVARYVAAQAAELSEHPLITWLADTPVPAGERLAIMIALAPFTRALALSCTWHIPYGAPQGELQAAVNARAAANAAQCSLLEHDWAALRLDTILGWGAGDMLWWLLVAGETGRARQAAMQIPVLAAADHGDPALRYSWVSALDACLDVLFSAARRAAGQDGPRCLYFGYARDPATLQAAPEFDPAAQAAAIELAGAAATAAATLFDSLYEYATSYIETGRTPARPAQAPEPERHASAWPLQPRLPQAARVVNGEIDEMLYRRRGTTVSHRLYSWLGSAPCRPADKLSVLLPEWALGILGTCDVCAHVLPLPRDPAAADLNTWARELAAQGSEFMADWDALRIDARLGWTASQTLRWLTTDPRMEEHRRGLARVARFAAACGAPLTRMWLLEVLAAACPARAPVTMDAAGQAGQDLGCQLGYLTGRRHPAPPARGRFRHLPLSLDDGWQVTRMIMMLFSGMERQFDQSLVHAEQLAARLPRPVPSSNQPLRQAQAAASHQR